MDQSTVDASLLHGVASTTLWTLYNRASEAARPDAVLHDPVAVDLLAAIDYPFRETFGEPDQSHPLRAVCFDNAIRDFLQEHPDGTVVSLGEGLETGFWRVDNGRVQWISLDFPEVIELRERLLPKHPRVRNIAGSALDFSWMSAVDSSRPVFISAQGLMPYLQPGAAIGLIQNCSSHFVGGRMLFDLVPPWHSKRSRRAKRFGSGYTVPPLPFSMTAAQASRLANWLPRVASAELLRPPAGRGWRRRLVAAVGRLPILRDHRFVICLLRFA